MTSVVALLMSLVRDIFLDVMFTLNSCHASEEKRVADMLPTLTQSRIWAHWPKANLRSQNSHSPHSSTSVSSHGLTGSEQKTTTKQGGGTTHDTS